MDFVHSYIRDGETMISVSRDQIVQRWDLLAEKEILEAR